MNDTHPEAERVQIALLQGMTPHRRGQIGSMLTNQSRWRTRQAIARAHPSLSEAQREMLFLELLYGRDLADKVRASQRGQPHEDAR